MSQNKPHIHAEVIKAWADGAVIQMNCTNGWKDMQNHPAFIPEYEYRIKPRIFENDAYYPAIDAFGAREVVYHINGTFYVTGDSRLYVKEDFKSIGEKLGITFPDV